MAIPWRSRHVYKWLWLTASATAQTVVYLGFELSGSSADRYMPMDRFVFMSIIGALAAAAPVWFITMKDAGWPVREPAPPLSFVESFVEWIAGCAFAVLVGWVPVIIIQVLLH